MIRDNIILALLLVSFQVADAVTTYLGIKAGCVETNKFAIKLDEWLRQFTGAKWAWIVLSKLGVCWLIWWLAYTYQDAEWLPWTLCALIGVYAYVIWHNLQELKRQRAING